MIQFYGTVLNTVKLAQLDNKWMQKKEEINNGNLAQMTAVERMVYQYEEQCRDMREEEDKQELYYKVAAGRELTPEEVAYLKENNPTAYQDYLDAKAERESYRRRLRECDTKEDVEKLKLNELGKFMAEAKKTASNPNIPKAQKLAIMQKILQRTMNVCEEHLEFQKSSQYHNLPDDMEEKKAREEGVSEEVTRHKDSETEDLAANNAEEIENTENSQSDNESNTDKTMTKLPDMPDEYKQKSDILDEDFKDSVKELKTLIHEVKADAKKIDMKV